LECKLCESQITFVNKKVKKPKINSLIDELNNALIEIKKPEISSLYGEGMLKKNIDKLIEIAESAVSKLQKL
jgi:DNA-directed RNA polymerase specialized sigma subunit